MRALVLMMLVAALAAAEDPALEERIPDGVTPDPAQRDIVRALAAEVYACRVRYDEDGDVERLFLSNHGIHVPREVDDKAAYQRARSGASDATFQRLAELPDLRWLQLIKQPITDESLAVLRAWPELEVFNIEYHEGDQTADFMLEINGHEHLAWLELKHLFGLRASRVDELGTFPNLVRVELDNHSAGANALPFLVRNPSIRDIELHRTSMDNDQIGAVVDALPNLQRLVLKPGGGDHFDHRCLAHVSRLPQLRVFGFHAWDEGMFVWEDGLEHLVGLEQLTHLEMSEGHWQLPAVQRLREARPELERAGKHIICEF